MINTVDLKYEESPRIFNEPAGVLRVSIFNAEAPDVPLASVDGALGDAAIAVEIADIPPNTQTRLFAMVYVLGARTGNVLHQIRTGDKVVEGPALFQFNVPASAALR